jgi:transposase
VRNPFWDRSVSTAICGAAAERGGRNGKKRAIIAVARKLAVLLHRLWVSGEMYEPLHNSEHRPLAIAA